MVFIIGLIVLMISQIFSVFLLFWIIANVLDKKFTFQSVFPTNRFNNESELFIRIFDFLNTNDYDNNLVYSNKTESINKDFSAKDLGLFLYEKVNNKVSILTDILTEAEIINEYKTAFCLDYYKFMAYSYLVNLYRVNIIDKIGYEKTEEFMYVFFKILSDSYINQEFKKSPDELMETFVTVVLKDFYDNDRLAKSLNEDPLMYLSVNFLIVVFFIPQDIIEKDYKETLLLIFNLFKETFEEIL